MNDVPYTIASSRMHRAFQVAFCFLWLALIIEDVVIHHDPATAPFADRLMDLGAFLFVFAVWILSTIMTFLNRTVFDEQGIEQRKLLRGRKQFAYCDIRKLNIRSGWVSSVSLLTYDGRQMMVIGNAKQLARAEEIIRERVPAVR